mmetsp:Transcript_4341/g.12472  ORF Transcript_4341/g.12472 Transcript_4341/m.12472 type:complete len:360 (+) Transcript_4341:2260-3339(+)
MQILHSAFETSQFCTLPVWKMEDTTRVIGRCSQPCSTFPTRYYHLMHEMEASMSESSAVSASPPFVSPRRNKSGFSAIGMLYVTVILTCWFHHEPRMLSDLIDLFNDSSCWNRSVLWHSHGYTNVTSAVTSLFTHADWEHVSSNMFVLWMSGKHLFVSRNRSFTEERQNPHDRCSSSLFSWTSPLAFPWFFFGSQFLSVVGCRFICHWLDREWARKAAQERKSWSWNWVPDSWRDAWFTLSHAQQAVDLRVWKLRPGIGSSAAVYGVVGAHVYASLCCRDHPAEMDVKTKTIWLAKIGMELARTPLSLEQISSLDAADNIDHASHICGFIGGFFLAFLWDRIIRIRKSFARHGNEMHDL